MKLTLGVLLLNLLETFGVSGLSVTNLLKNLVMHLHFVLSQTGIHLMDTLL